MEATHATHVVSYKGNTRNCTPETYQEVCDALIGQYGTGDVPNIAPLAPPPAAAQAPAVTRDPNISLDGKFRSEMDEHAALEAGFSPEQPIYSVGTRVNSDGVTNARAMQAKHDKKPSAVEVANKLVSIVQAEQRRDLTPIRTAELRMDREGLLVLPDAGGDVGKGQRYPLTPRAFASLFSRFPCPSGVAYLKGCPALLRSRNYNHWAVEVQNLEEQNGTKPSEQSRTVLRTRQGSAGPEVFTSVSPGYTPFDADKIGAALAKAFPEDAKGSLDYNGERMRLEGLWRTDVAPGEFVAGEFFKAGVIVRSDDTGAGSIRVQSVLWRNLCLNLIILDKAIGVDVRIKHTGSVEQLARRFRQAFSQALTSVEPFRKAWGYAMAEKDERLVQRVQGTTSEDLSKLPASAVLPGIFNGILERDLIPVRGRRKDIVPQLLQMHAQDEAATAYGVSRASVLNAFTRYAHVLETDAFEADEIRSGAGRLLSAKAGREPAPLPYVAFAG